MTKSHSISLADGHNKYTRVVRKKVQYLSSQNSATNVSLTNQWAHGQKLAGYRMSEQRSGGRTCEKKNERSQRRLFWNNKKEMVKWTEVNTKKKVRFIFWKAVHFIICRIFSSPLRWSWELPLVYQFYYRAKMTSVIDNNIGENLSKLLFSA